jgi:RNA polymerase sigma-70 factor (ECF subfamily)
MATFQDARTQEDGALAAAVLRGEPGAAEELFDRVFDPLYRRVCARLGGDHDTAQDVVSESLLAGLRSLDGFRGEASLATWFFRIAVRKIADRKRRRVVELVTGDDGQLETYLAGKVPEEPSALDRLADEETRGILYEVLESLPARHRCVLRWKYLDDSTVGEVALRLKVSPKAAERRLARARAALSSALRERRLEI